MTQEECVCKMSSIDHDIPRTKNTKSKFKYALAKNSSQAVWNISFLNLKQRESHFRYKEIFHVAYYNVITPDLAFVMTGFLPIGEYRASGLYSAGKTGSRTAQYHSESPLHRTLIILARCACAYREICVCEQGCACASCGGCFPISVYICVRLCKYVPRCCV